MSRLFHVTSARNRASIRAHGLDWSRMSLAHGIAGSRRPEEEGIFLCLDEHEAKYFVDMNNTGGPVDVWAVEGVDESDLIESGNGYRYLPRCIPPENLTIVRESVKSDGWGHRPSGPGPTTAYQSTLTITLDDGSILRDADAHEFFRRAVGDPGTKE